MRLNRLKVIILCGMLAAPTFAWSAPATLSRQVIERVSIPPGGDVIQAT